MIRTNRISGDDNMLMLMSIALKPLAQPPVPLHELGNELGLNAGRTLEVTDHE
jgi:hypothetical protein